MAVDSDQQTRQDQTELADLRSITGISPAEERAMEDRALTDDMAEREGLRDTGDEKEKQNNDPASDGFYNDKDGKKKRLSFITKKRAAITAGGAGGILSIFVFVSLTLPGFVISNLRELMLNNPFDLQTSQQMRYRRSKIARVSDAFSREGRIGSKIISEMEFDGYTFHFDPSDRNRIVGVTLPGGNQAIPNISGVDALGEHISDYMEVKHPLRTARWKTKRMESFYNRYGVSRVSVVNRAIPDLETPERTVNKAIAGSIMHDEYDPRVSGGDLPEDASDADRAARDAALEAAEDSELYSEFREDTLENGTPARESRFAVGGIFNDIPDGVSSDVHRFANIFGNDVSAVGALKSLSVGDVADKVCTVKNRLRTAVTAARSVRALSMLRYAGVFIGASDEIRTGNADPKLINELMKRVTTNDRNGNPIGASPGFAYAVKGRFSRSANDSLKSSYGVDGKLTGVYASTKSAFDRFPFSGSRSCGVWQNPITQVGIGVIEIGLAIFTGGGSAVVEQSTKTAVVSSVRSFIQNVTTRQIVKSLAITAAVELSFEGIMALTQMYAERTLAMNFSGQESGGQLGGILIGGGGTLKKQKGLQAGMVPATAMQYAAAEADHIAWKKEDMAKKSFFARVLDVNNPDSLMFGSMMNLALSTPAGVASISHIANKSITSFGSVFSLGGLLGILGGTASAQDSDEVSFDVYETEGEKNIDLAVDPAGNTLVVHRPDITEKDPIENRDELIASNDINPTTYEPMSQAFVGHVTNCVEAIDIISMIEGGDESKPEQDCLATQEKTKKFKAHLAYLDMIDGLEGHFIPEEIASGSTRNNSSSGDNSGRVVADTSSVVCAPGTEDLGVSDGYSSGDRYEIRLCGIPGIPSTSREDPGIIRVNSVVSANWLGLSEAASAAGITLRAHTSHRSMEYQQDLYNRYINGRGNRAATPGTSNHQMGYAVDFVMDKPNLELKECQANPSRYPIYEFLATNAPSFNIHARLEDECWHWANGS